MLDQPFVSGLPGHHKGAARPLKVPPICAEGPVCRKLNREDAWLLLAVCGNVTAVAAACDLPYEVERSPVR